ncbi:YSIRK-type signal peptide-containing protein [Lactobacillus sp. ESL0731]|uniref:YSIRK-type signal peptide-containing protein n=1 Tax=unclassified Lactobacillus TaxID=2620435 RepID=UPI0023F848F8|nr:MULTISPECIES: YSIRK-type signal peptide-containing protein [unclassified Lactobacillus]WEV51824.1 YSIRK-type signal peptide-containing protein [Lactobacillus sp. ESL0700]WEV62953.1 YSIRK-type signal peptide-containing protein [Lactobacillus sp. ESL0731]
MSMENERLIMLGKNNYTEKSRKLTSRSTRERFSIRKLSVGAASVLLGVTFLGLSSQSAKADTITDNTQQVVKAPKNDNLSTYKGLSSFLRDDKTNQESTTTATVTTSTDTTTPVATPAQAATSTPVTTNDSKDDSLTINQGDTNKGNTNVAQPAAVQTKEEINPKIAGTVAKVSTWDEFTAAIHNGDVREIDLENNITSNKSGFDNLQMGERQILIQSDLAKNQRFVLDLRYYGPRPDDGETRREKLPLGHTDLTYRNLDIYSQTYYGLANTLDGTKTPCKLTLDNVNFVGSQAAYTGQYTDIYIKGTVNAAAVLSYISPIDGKTYKCDGAGQQLYELYAPGQNLYFTKDCTFVGSTSDGNVLELSQGINDNKGPNGRSRTNNIVIDSGADVTLNPRQNASINGDSAQHSSKASGIAIINGEGTVTVNKEAKLTINVGASDYTGGLDKYRASAISMSSASSNGAKLIDNGTITINTNGDISQSTGGDSKAGTLIYDQGSMQIGPGGALNVYGKNMQDYSGTLVYITDKADLNNGSLDIELQNDSKHPNDPSYGAGKNKIILIDTDNNIDPLTVNNPRKLVLNAANNKATGTSIIGDKKINIKNARQVIDFSSLYPQVGKITLPPFHILNVRKKALTTGEQTIGIDDIAALNGNQVISDTELDAVKKVINDPKNKGIQQVLQQALNTDDVVAYLQDAQSKGMTIDQIFSEAISNEFSNSQSQGYNNITMVSANQGGFLDIEDDNGNLGQASYHQNADGTILITGKVVNFNTDVDGPVQSNNILSQIIPCGMYPYVKAQIRRVSNIYTNGQALDPYAKTNDITGDLGHVYSVEANSDGKFSITFASNTPGIYSGAVIDLTPEANFIGFDPEITGKTAIAHIGEMNDSEEQRLFAEWELNDCLQTEKKRIMASGLTKDKQQPYLDKVQKEHDNAIYGIEHASNLNMIKNYHDHAMDVFNHEAAKSELAGYGDECITNLKLADSDNTYQQIIDIVVKGSNYIDNKYGSTDPEEKGDASLINQVRDVYEDQILSTSKAWLNSLLDKQGSDAKVELDKHELQNIDELKAQVDQYVDTIKGNVTGASNSRNAYVAYTNGKKQIADFVSSQLSDVLQQEAIQNVKNKWTSCRAALMKLKNLPIAKQLAYRSQLNSVMSTALAKIKTATGDNLTQAYNDFVKSADDIVKAATDENNK